MKTFTIRAAIKETKKLWDWMADNPGLRKSRYPGWEQLKSEYNVSHIGKYNYGDPFYNHCPCCMYVAIKLGGLIVRAKDCIDYCPLSKEWTTRPVYELSHSVLCQEEDSPYEVWRLATSGFTEDVNSARQISELCTRALARLNSRRSKRVGTPNK